jgi:signal transduction histidine kinase
MLKVMAVLRTIVLAFLVGYLLWELPIALLLFSGEARSAGVNVNIDTVKKVAAVAWLAVGWIAVETALAWGRAWSAGRAARKTERLAPPPSPGASGAR